MNPQIEAALRAAMKLDGEIGDVLIDQAICVMKGDEKSPESPLRYIPFKKLYEMSGLNKGLVAKYMKLGVLERAYRPGKQAAIGVTRESYRRLTTRHTKNWPPEMEAMVRSRIRNTQAYHPKDIATVP